jgi:hypothetical protein
VSARPVSDDPSDQSREDVPTTREERVRACMRLMPAQWERGKTSRVLAKAWGVSVAVVEQASAEAWRRLNAQDVGWVREHICYELSCAMDTAKNIEDLKDRVHEIVEVSKAWAPLVGAGAPQKHEHSVLVAALAQSEEWRTVLAVLQRHPAALADVQSALSSRLLEAKVVE